MMETVATTAARTRGQRRLSCGFRTRHTFGARHDDRYTVHPPNSVRAPPPHKSDGTFEAMTAKAPALDLFAGNAHLAWRLHLAVASLTPGLVRMRMERRKISPVADVFDRWSSTREGGIAILARARSYANAPTLARRDCELGGHSPGTPLAHVVLLLDPSTRVGSPRATITARLRHACARNARGASSRKLGNVLQA
jgi:hypothetical protein